MPETARPHPLTFGHLLLACLSAALFFIAFELNDLFLRSFEYRHGVNWIFLPAGLRVLLVLIMGAPGALGILLGTWLLDFNATGSLAQGVWLNGLVSGGVPLALMRAMQHLRLLPQRLSELDRAQIVVFTLLYAALNALGHQGVWWVLKQPGQVLWLDVWPMFVGDALGVVLCLQAWRLALWLKDRMSVT